MIEVELKYPVDSLHDIRNSLFEMGGLSQRQVHQVDEYFENETRRMQSNDCALRIRKVDDQHVLTFKGPKLQSNAKIREEIELPLGIQPAATDLKAILAGCGYTVAGVVEKNREIIALNKEDCSIEVCLDQVRGLGHFVELELVVENEQVKIDAARIVLKELANELSLTGSITKSYLELLQAP